MNENEQRKRDLVYYLLDNDVIVYKMLKSQVQSLDSERFNNLYNGNTEYDYKILNKNFLRLVEKFDNFSVILLAWETNKDYYPYLQQIWRKYICLEDLKPANDDTTFINTIKSYDIDIDKWPKDAIIELKEIINNTDKTQIFLNELKVNYYGVYSVMEELLQFKEIIQEDIQQHKIYDINSKILLEKLFEDFLYVPIGVPIQVFLASQAKNDKITNIATEMISKSVRNKNIARDIAKEALKSAKKRKFTGNLAEPKSRILRNLNIECKKGNPNVLNFNETTQVIFESELFCTANCILSFLNLGWSIYQIHDTVKELDKINYLRTRLTTIKGDFKNHKDSLGVLPEDPIEAAKKIKEVFILISDDHSKLVNLIEEIIQKIEYQEIQRKKAIGGTIVSSIFSFVSILGGIITFNGIALGYGISALANIASTALNATNIVLTTQNISDLRKLLSDAQKEEENMKKEIEELYRKISYYYESIPKYKH